MFDRAFDSQDGGVEWATWPADSEGSRAPGEELGTWTIALAWVAMVSGASEDESGLHVLVRSEVREVMDSDTTGFGELGRPIEVDLAGWF